MTPLSVHFTGVSKRYPHFSLDNIDLALPTGSIMGFVGANGAGKSTTIRILMGLVHQDTGAVEVLGHPMPDDQAAAKRDIGFVSEDMRLYEAATLAWHMKFIQSIFPRWDQRYADNLLRRFDLKPQQKIKGLSHGQRVKAALLLALARRPRLLVLDEPTTGLDPVARHEVLAELMAVLTDEDRTIFFSSQNTLDVEQISDQITFIDRGRIIDSANKEIFLDRWRRLRLMLPPDRPLPRLPGVVEIGGSTRLPVLTINQFDPAMVALCQDAGAAVQSIDAMTLEEIFIANVQSRRDHSVAVSETPESVTA
jgi:ABC-2 type transport system ATP-binding protein